MRDVPLVFKFIRIGVARAEEEDKLMFNGYGISILQG